MNIQQISDYIDDRNNRRILSGDRYADYVSDAFGQHITNSNARTLITNLLIGDDKAAAQMLRDFLIAEFGEKAEAFASEKDAEPFKPYGRFHSRESDEAGIPSVGEI